MPATEIERLPAHPDAVLALTLDPDPIPYRPGLLETHLGITPDQNGRLRAPERDETPMVTEATLEPETAPQAGLLARLEALECSVSDLDDNMGACLEEHGDLLGRLCEAAGLQTYTGPETPESKLDYARRAMEVALADMGALSDTLLDPGSRRRLDGAMAALAVALEETRGSDDADQG
jgi:hypothetical protein